MYVCMYGHHMYTASKGRDQPGKVNRKNDFSNLVSRDGFGNPVPRQPAHLHTQAESGAS